MRRHESKVNILMVTVAVLFCATLFSMHFTGGLYARYSTSASGSDSARVAKFDVNPTFTITERGTTAQNIRVDVTPGNTQIAKLTIVNNSEVAVEYKLEVKNVTGNLKSLKYKLVKKDADSAAVTTDKHENGISISGATQLPGNHTDTYNLEIVWEANGEDALEFIDMLDYITVSVTATQVD